MTVDLTRRRFLATSAAAAVAAQATVVGAQAPFFLRGARAPSVWSPDDPATLKALSAAALDAATRAGAAYADVRVRFNQREEWRLFSSRSAPAPSQTFTVGVGVRALVRGYWGFAAADGVASADLMAGLGRAAAAQAIINAKGPARDATLAPVPVVRDGVWAMPVEVDPFTVSYEEKSDFILGVHDDLQRQAHGVFLSTELRFAKELRSFASSDGSFCVQTVFASTADMQLQMEGDFRRDMGVNRTVDVASPAGAGWEYIMRAPFRDRFPGFLDDARRMRQVKPVEIGRYDMVFDAHAMANILDCTIGAGTELERAMGFHAADGGTSFLDDPLEMLGTYQIGAPLVTVTADRSMPGGGATVKWDDEGVAPPDVALVTKGLLTDFQTTRESASWLAPYYQKAGRPVRSTGAAGADEATQVTQGWPSNFTLAPGSARDATFETLVANTKKGYAVKGGQVSADYQCLNGVATGDVVFEIVDGKLGPAVQGAQVMFRAPEFWKNVAALGGDTSAEQIGVNWGRSLTRRRELFERFPIGYTVRAVPALVTQVAMADRTRKA